MLVTEINIISTGAAFRKVFTALVLLWVLAECPQTRKFYLMEEPEALLYPSFTARFTSVLLQTANTAQIQVVIATNTLFEMFNEKVTIYLIYYNKN